LTDYDILVWSTEPLLLATTPLHWLSPLETYRLEQFRRPADQQRFATGRVVARAAAARLLGTTPAEVSIAVGPADGPTPGRPSIDGCEWSLSIAHSGSRVLVALAPIGSVGVDVEQLPDDPTVLAGIRDAVPAAEAPTAGWTDPLFLRSWVRREAVLKAVGVGLLAPRDDLVLGPADGPPTVLRSSGGLPAVARMTLTDLTVANGYLAAAALLDGPGMRTLSVSLRPVGPLRAELGVAVPG
jgi:4'-phosphopantetheinyl transferase